jgi:dTDP-4-amino-4,6-dideoxygalactose transaminase
VVSRGLGDVYKRQYCASANVVVHSGAKPVMVDINESDFNISVDAIRKAITPRTKAIIAVDLAGFPCDYDAIMDLVNEQSIQSQFTPQGENQEKLNRILIISDAAHSFGAIYKGKRAGSMTDISTFSFHAVKNLTTAEGGALCFDLPENFDH